MSESISHDVQIEGGTPGAVWKFTGNNTGLSCQIEDNAVWLLTFLDGGVVVEVRKNDPRLKDFFENFDIEPIFIVKSKIGNLNAGWWLEFADGRTFESRSLLDRLVERSRHYTEEKVELRADLDLPDLH